MGSKSWTRLELREIGRTLLTRNQGEKVRAKLMSLLRDFAGVEVVLDGVEAYTPSFVDELLGKAFKDLGRRGFRQRIRLIAATGDVRHLVNLVLSNRAAQASA